MTFKMNNHEWEILELPMEKIIKEEILWKIGYTEI